MNMSRVSRLAVLARNFTTSAIRRSGHDDHDTSGIPGSVRDFYLRITGTRSLMCLLPLFLLQNLPFKINNKYGLTIKFALFFASGFGIPFFAVRHQLLKQ
ncbi:hypothetical protein HPB51_022452 [Rhipicephalus microplus]|uniref:Cytochrome c oxidase subunit 7C, mitochondrial n=1 Tax=Rhipicephalus microplus TaxID=6941 RepID=A0A9J6DQ16_RHIMP|nr:hypothetical protein HPB51_022452 [Rhipicephalus microplus]